MERGRTNRFLKKYTEAISDLNEAIKLKPDLADAYFLRGTCRYSISDFPGALSDFTETIKISPEFYEAYIERGYCFNKMKKPDEAIRDLKKAYALFPINFLSLVDVIEILFVNGKKQEAESYLTEAKKHQWVDHQSIIFVFFTWLFKKVDGQNASEEMNKILELQKNIYDIKYNFTELKDWLNDATLDTSMKDEVGILIARLDSLNKDRESV